MDERERRAKPLISAPSYTGPDRRASATQVAELATALAEQTRLSALDLAARQREQELEAAKERQVLAEELAEKRGRKEASLEIWQRGIDSHNEKQNGKLGDLVEDVKRLTKSVDSLVSKLAEKSKNDVTVLEFRKWAAGFAVAAVGVYFAAGGHIG